MAEAIETFVAAADRTPGQPPGWARRARQLLYAVIEAESADLAGRQSLRWMWNEQEYGGSYFGDAPDGGYRRLADAMASGVDVRLGRPVSEIAASPDGVRVLTADGRAEEGSHVVVTVPLGVLKRGLPRFSPALPPDRLAAIERLGFGRFEKVALRFAEPFWRDAGFPQLMVFPREPGEWMVWAMGLDAFGDGPVVVFFVFHSAAERLADADADAERRIRQRRRLGRLGARHARRRRPAARARSRPRWPSARGRPTRGRAAPTPISRREPARRMPTCSASRSADGSCSRASTPRARASPMPTAR